MWLQCISVVSECCCKEICRFPHNVTYPYSTCIALFCGSIPNSLFIFCFSFLFMLFLCNTANIAQRTFEVVQKLISRGHGDIITYIDKNINYKSEASTCEVPIMAS